VSGVSQGTLEWRERDGVRWLHWEGAGVAAAFPSWVGGVSPAPHDSLNLGLSTADEPGCVLENRRRLCHAVGLHEDGLVVPGQVHGTAMAWVDAGMAGRGAFASVDVIAERDALLTTSPGLGLGISYADCVPVVIVAAGDEGPCFATVHAGWRGMIGGIVGRAAAALGERGRLVCAVVGPSIGPCCYAVDAALRERFAARFPGSAQATSVDLWACARAELVAAGLPAEAVSETRVCTASDARFFSHRRDHGATGRHLAIAWRQEA
jgi:YfiH family protein